MLFKQTLFYSGIILLLICSARNISIAQNKPSVSNVTIKAEEGQMTVYYDLESSSSTDLFKVWLEVQTQSGVTITPKTLSGDVGERVSGGAAKKIIWNNQDDGIMLATNVNVTVKAKRLKSTPAMARINKKDFLLTAAFPGWGQYKQTGNTSYLALGAIAYGCLIGAKINNTNAVANYDKYLESVDFTESKDLYKKWDNQNQTSKYLAAGAAIIWVADLIWTFEMFRKPNSFSQRERSDKNYSFGYSINPVLYNPELSFTYRF